jgi:hypothetical protein
VGRHREDGREKRAKGIRDFIKELGHEITLFQRGGEQDERGKGGKNSSDLDLVGSD